MGRQLHDEQELLKWNEWSPGLDTDDMTLAQVLASMPAAEAEEVPEIIRKYENPESPDALPGSVSLARHDCIHVIVGRGLHVQDEAFVIGATMGADSTFTEDTLTRFIEISTTLYPKYWRFEEEHIASYKLGVGFAFDHPKMRDIHLVPLENEEWQNKTVREIRRHFGIVKEEIRAYLRAEVMLTPGTTASNRLDTCGRRLDRALSSK